MNADRIRSDLRHVVLGNPDNRRIAFFQDALARSGFSQATVISYQELLDGVAPIEALFEQADILRIESPGEDFEVEKRLIARGAEHPDLGNCQSVSNSAARALEPDRGRLRLTRQWYLGYRDLLSRLRTEQQRYSSVILYNAPADIELMFDKPRCQHFLQHERVPVPDMLRDVQNYDDLVSRAFERKWKRVFVKLAHGSSASGVVALHFADRAVRAVSTVELVRQHGSVLLYNNLRLTTYTDLADIRTIVDFLCAESAQVERWMQKASLGRRTFDLRVLVIDGVAQHTVVRTSSSPMTNLHLGNRRGSLNDLISRLGPDRWRDIQETASRCARLFTQSLYVGVDLLITPDLRDEVILEVNAFGDLLPGVEWEGRDPYESEVMAIRKRTHGRLV